MHTTITEQIQSAIEIKSRVLQQMPGEIAAAAEILIASLQNGGAVALCGNGGSAADCQHLSGELVGRFRRERRAIRAFALTVDTSVITAIANDYAYDDVFARQVEGLLRPGDVLVAISTSGQAENCLRAVDRAREMGVHTIAMTGESGGRLKDRVDLCLCVPANDTARVQEVHILIGHILCDIIETALMPPAGDASDGR